MPRRKPSRTFAQGISSFIGRVASRRCQLVFLSKWQRNILEPMLELAASLTTYHFENDSKNTPGATTRRFTPTSLRSIDARRFLHYRLDSTGHCTTAPS